MRNEDIKKTLHQLVGHVVIKSDKQQRDFELLSKSLAHASLPDDNRLLMESDFSITKADIFFDETIPKQRFDVLDKLADKIETDKEPRYRVFVREVPIREQLIHASVPDWAAGASVSHTIGPFVHKDGRQFWYDFFPITKLITLFIQGIAEPVMLFKIKQRQPTVTPVERPVPIALKKTYNLAKGSIWINARFLAPNAPVGSYTGLTINGGEITLGKPPVDLNGQLTVTASTKISVQLDLNQPEVTDADEASSYGVDARNLKLELPENLSFHFSGQGRTIDEAGGASWNLYGQTLGFKWDNQAQATFDPVLRRIVFPYSTAQQTLQIIQAESKFNRLNHSALINRRAWALPVATIDINQPTEAAGIGAMLVQCDTGLGNTWQGLEGSGFHLANPAFLVSPGQILLGDLTTGNPHAHQSLDLWKDEINEFGAKVELTFPANALFFYIANANGSELLMSFANADFQVDRPVTVNCEPPAVSSLNSILLIGVSSQFRLIYLFDDNLIQDAGQLSNEDPFIPEPMSLALTNALFRVSQVNGALLFGSLSDDFSKVESGFLFLTFGLYAYLPTLPDPYAANLGALRNQIRGQGNIAGTTAATGAFSNPQITAWLVCRIKWEAPAEEDDNNEVEVSFHFAPLSNQFGGISLEDTDADSSDADPPTPPGFVGSGPSVSGGITAASGDFAVSQLNNNISNAIAAHNINVASGNLSADTGDPAAAIISHDKPLPDYEEEWDGVTGRLRRNLFALLDVSTNADLFGVSFNLLSRHSNLVTTHAPITSSNTTFPIQVKGMEVISQGQNVKAFTVPQISWEPLINLTQPFVTGDPPPGFNYYPDDGGSMQILNNSDDTVALAPLPLTDYLLANFEEDTDNFTVFSLMTLPFGLKALAVLQNEYNFTDENGVSSSRKGSEVLLNAEEFEDDMRGGLQLQFNAGEAYINGESDMFVGNTVQLNNVLDFVGNSQGDSTLGRTVTEIFNNEFFDKPIQQRGVPLTRIDLSGYGASTFSNWLNPAAAFAQTSQAKFDIFVGRCAHEIIQVKSIIYPWGIKVVRTITMFRVGSGYVYRFDSGWKPESNGEFDFRYFVTLNPADKNKVEMPSPFDIHPGVVRGLFNVQNIIETEEIATAEGQMISEKIVNENNQYIDNPEPNDLIDFKLQPVYFDADIEIDDVVSGFTTKKVKGKDKDLVSAKKIVGYVQSAPKGIPITKETLRNLVLLQMGSIGGPIDCEVNLAGSDQKMRLNRFDFNNSFDKNGSDIIFAVAGRGNVLLPKEGAWSMVKHDRDTGEVSPVPSNLSLPVIREGKLIKDNSGQKLDTPINSVLLRIANPTELKRTPAADTLNYGFLQSTDTQKALFLTPSFEVGKKKLYSKTPPLFVDAFRIVNSKAVFPNIGNAGNDLGDAISLIPNGDEFLKGSLQDLGEDVWELMDITGAAENAKEQGYNLLKEVATFELPNQEFELIDVGDGNFRIYIEYEQKDENGNTQTKADLDFSINSLANDVVDTWKSRMGNIGLVVDLAGIDRLMTIRGSWDSKKGSEAAYPQPELVFSKELQPVIDILEILQQLQGGDYAGAVGNGLKLAMSNKAGTWEYKFEASKEIPVLRFPVPDAVYNDPNTPLKLEAGLTVGAYFNAALKVTNDANELLPSAGGLLGFYGRLSVMCVSLSAATVYAIGQVNLDIAADTKIGPSLRMKFGFGAQIVIGLPVAGNVSVLFVVGVEIFAASGIIEVTAFMLFEGHAEILGGIVSITIRIEAKGTISKKAIDNDSRTDLACQVTFGLDISIFLVININFETSWSEQRQIAGSKKL